VNGVAVGTIGIWSRSPLFVFLHVCSSMPQTFLAPILSSWPRTPPMKHAATYRTQKDGTPEERAAQLRL
jgi:hypothetical protein